MLVQVTGFMVATVVLVLWLWIADVRRWWPFDSTAHVQHLLDHHVGFEVVRMLAATALDSERIAVATVASATFRAPSEALTGGARRPLRTLAMSTGAEGCDDVHTRACSRPDHASSGRPSGRRRHRLSPRHDGAASCVNGWIRVTAPRPVSERVGGSCASGLLVSRSAAVRAPALPAQS
jgi:hypothetical protein